MPSYSELLDPRLGQLHESQLSFLRIKVGPSRPGFIPEFAFLTANDSSQEFSSKFKSAGAEFKLLTLKLHRDDICKHCGMILFSRR
jgi:hypothetical protein